jgi:hypothetical protein
MSVDQPRSAKVIGGQAEIARVLRFRETASFMVLKLQSLKIITTQVMPKFCKSVTAEIDKALGASVRSREMESQEALLCATPSA